MSSNKRVEILGGSINYYERGDDNLYKNVRVLKKRINGIGTNNKVLNLRSDPIYGTKTDWTNTAVDCYVNKVIFEQSESILVWADSIINNDNEFTIKVYEKYLSPTSIGTNSIYRTGDSAINYYYSNKNKIDFTFSGTMSGFTSVDGHYISIRMITYRDNVPIQNDYIKEEDSESLGFNFNTNYKTNTKHNYRIQIIFDVNCLKPILNGTLIGNTYIYDTVENNSTDATFYAYEN